MLQPTVQNTLGCCCGVRRPSLEVGQHAVNMRSNALLRMMMMMKATRVSVRDSILCTCKLLITVSDRCLLVHTCCGQRSTHFCSGTVQQIEEAVPAIMSNVQVMSLQSRQYSQPHALTAVLTALTRHCCDRLCALLEQHGNSGMCSNGVGGASQ